MHAYPLPSLRLTNKAFRIQRRNQTSPLPFAIEAEIQTNKARAVHENGGFSKSEIRVADRYASTIFKCKGTNLAPSIRRTSIKKKSKRTTHLSNTKLREQILQIRNSKQATEGLPSIPAMGFDQSDDTEDYCNFEDLRRISAASALLYRIKRKNCSNSPSKFPKIHQEDDSSYSYTTPSTNSYSRYVNGEG
ncbi:hypothetical protein U1Q18_030918 [Sarracenia purpurea var. burkii]